LIAKGKREFIESNGGRFHPGKLEAKVLLREKVRGNFQEFRKSRPPSKELRSEMIAHGK
jgi:hypothetical protein